MKGKVITIIGILIMVLVASSYIMFEAFVKDTSNVTAQNVVVAKQAIPENTVIHNVEEAMKYFEIKRVTNDYVVEGAIVLDTTDMGNAGLIAQIQDAFSTDTTNTDELKKLVGYKITRNYAKNEQILAEYLSTDIVEFKDDERLYAIETSYINSVAAEIKVGDYVDLWLLSTENDVTTSKKIIGPLKIYKLKTSDNVTIADGATAIPSIVLFKLNEETIEYISTLESQGTVFFVKYGAKPTKAEIDNVLENAKDENKVDNNKNDNVVENTTNENKNDTVVDDTNKEDTTTDAE